MKLYFIAIYDIYDNDNIAQTIYAETPEKALKEALLRVRTGDPDHILWVEEQLDGMEYCEMAKDALNADYVVSDYIVMEIKNMPSKMEK